MSFSRASVRFVPQFLPLRIIVIAGVCLVLRAAAVENIDATVLRLGSDNYDERESATEELGRLPGIFARVLLKLSANAQDVEIRDRLRVAAQSIFERQIGATDERWLRLHGSLRIAYQPQFLVTLSEAEEKDRQPLGMAVSWVDKDGPCEQVLKQHDVITEINGVKLGARDIDELVKPGTEYELTVRRYANTMLVSERDYVTSDDTDFDEVKLKVVAGWRQAHQVDADCAANVMAALWQEFLEDFKNSTEEKYAVLKQR